MAEKIIGRTWWFLGDMQEMHFGFFEPSAAFMVITGRAGCGDILPDMQSSQMSRDHVVNG
jgi:hypothetical protein